MSRDRNQKSFENRTESFANTCTLVGADCDVVVGGDYPLIECQRRSDQVGDCGAGNDLPAGCAEQIVSTRERSGGRRQPSDVEMGLIVAHPVHDIHIFESVARIDGVLQQYGYVGTANSSDIWSERLRLRKSLVSYLQQKQRF